MTAITTSRTTSAQRRTIITAAAALSMLGVFAAPAAAHHQHQLVNPGTTVVFKCEPQAAADVHPIHNGLHMAHKINVPAASPVSVGPIIGATCSYS